MKSKLFCLAAILVFSWSAMGYEENGLVSEGNDGPFEEFGAPVKDALNTAAPEPSESEIKGEIGEAGEDFNRGVPEPDAKMSSLSGAESKHQAHAKKKARTVAKTKKHGKKGRSIASVKRKHGHKSKKLAKRGGSSENRVR